MFLDRFKTALRDIVLDILAEEGPAPFGRIVPGEVVKQNSDGSLDLKFYDPANLVIYISGVPIIGEVGRTYKYTAGTTVAVAWFGGYESLPVVLAGSWWGSGTLDQFEQKFDNLLVFDGKVVQVKQDLKYEHDVVDGGSPIITPGLTAAVLLGGGDRLFAVQCVVAGGPGVPTGTAMFTATYARQWTQSLVMAQGQINPLGVVAGCIATPTNVVVQVGFVAPTLPAGTYTVVIRSGAA